MSKKKLMVIGVSPGEEVSPEVLKRAKEEGIEIQVVVHKDVSKRPRLEDVEPFIIRTIERYEDVPYPKTKGHQRPYKFHR